VRITDQLQVVQVYVEWTNKSLPSPQRQLVGFERVFIPVGQGVTAHFDVSLEQIAVWNDHPPSFVTLQGAINNYDKSVVDGTVMRKNEKLVIWYLFP
jgi:hypothetical protein